KLRARVCVRPRLMPCSPTPQPSKAEQPPTIVMLDLASSIAAGAGAARQLRIKAAWARPEAKIISCIRVRALEGSPRPPRCPPASRAQASSRPGRFLAAETHKGTKLNRVHLFDGAGRGGRDLVPVATWDEHEVRRPAVPLSLSGAHVRRRRRRRHQALISSVV